MDSVHVSTIGLGMPPVMDALAGMEIPDELAGTIRGSYFVIKGGY